MARVMLRTIFVAAALAALALPASAQLSPNDSKSFDVKTMNFDLWCQEQAMLPPDRCDQRTPEDEQQFEAYRAKIEKYELPYLEDKRKEFNFDRNVLDKDPVDNPTDKQANPNEGTPSPGSATPSP